MRITIDYDPNNNNLSVLVDRGALSNGWPPSIPPPPPGGGQFAELTTWLNGVFETCMTEFKDQSVGAIRFKYEPQNKVQKKFIFNTSYEEAPAPPSFIK